MFKATTLLIYLIFTCQISYAKDSKTNTTEPHEITDASVIDQITGVYREFFEVDIIGSKEKFPVDNSLKIVKLDDNNIFFTIQLRSFFDGHQCHFFGKAVYRGNNLFLYDKEPELCKLAIYVGDRNIAFIDNYDKDVAYCGFYYCGQRGHLDGASFKRSTRRPIDYMDELKDSGTYREFMTRQTIAAEEVAAQKLQDSDKSTEKKVILTSSDSASYCHNADSSKGLVVQKNLT